MQRVVSLVVAMILMASVANAQSRYAYRDGGRRWGVVLGGQTDLATIETSQVSSGKKYESGATINWHNGLYDFGFLLDQSKTPRKGVEEVVVQVQWTDAGKYRGVLYRYTYPMVRKQYLDFGGTFAGGYGRDTGQSKWPLELLATARILHADGAIAFQGGYDSRMKGFTFGAQFQMFDNRNR